MEIKIYGAFVLNQRVVLHAIDATPARWRGDAGSSPLDRARTAASSPRNDSVKNCRVHPTHWLISTQVLGRDFSWSISRSRRDGEEALVLNYAAAPTPDRLFGTVLRMRDELRELEPGVLLGIGSMMATGGMRNGAPFILRRRSGGDDADEATE